MSLEYQVVFGYQYVHNLVNLVNEEIKKGWRPCGGLVVTGEGEHVHYGQAMTRERQERRRDPA